MLKHTKGLNLKRYSHVTDGVLDLWGILGLEQMLSAHGGQANASAPQLCLDVDGGDHLMRVEPYLLKDNDDTVDGVLPITDDRSDDAPPPLSVYHSGFI